MTDPLPPPPVPASADLRSFPYLPLDVQRLRDSGLAAVDNAEAFRAAILSYCAAWHQVPAGSLPDDDRKLCRLLGYGQDLRRWRSLRAAGALRGWILHADGRLYHRVVTEKTLIALDSQSKAKALRASPLMLQSGEPDSRDLKPSHLKNNNFSSTTERNQTEINRNPSASSATEWPDHASTTSNSQLGIEIAQTHQEMLGNRRDGLSATKWSSPEARDQFAVRKIVDHLPGSAEERWSIAMSGEDPTDPHYKQACRLMRKAAMQAGVGWISPHLRRRSR